MEALDRDLQTVIHISDIFCLIKYIFLYVGV